MNTLRLGGSYLLHEPIGRGAMGQVWRGSLVSDGSPVAIKVLRPELAEDADVVARFHREGSIMVAIRHPCVVGIREVVAEGETLAIVMDLIEGGDLRAYLKSAGSLPPAEALRLTGQVLAGLQAVHSAGILHRDLKPENILIDKTGSRGPVARLTDFGIGRFVDGQTQTKATGLIGTPQYLAPEVIENRKATPASDLYSVGIVLYELLTGRAPFTASHPAAMLRQHLEEQPVRPGGLSHDLWAFVSELLEKNPQRRPPSSAEAARLSADLAHKYAGSRALDLAPPAVRVDRVQETVGTAYRAATNDSPSALAPSNEGLGFSDAQFMPGARSRSAATATPARSWRSRLIGAIVVGVSVVAVALVLAMRSSPDNRAPAFMNIPLEQLEQLVPTTVLIDAPDRRVAATGAMSTEAVLKQVSSSPNGLSRGEGADPESDQRWLADNELTAVQPKIDVRFTGYSTQVPAGEAIQGLSSRIPRTYRGHDLLRVFEGGDHHLLAYGDNEHVPWTRLLVSVDADYEAVRYTLDLVKGYEIQWLQEHVGTLYLLADSGNFGIAAIEVPDGKLIWQQANGDGPPLALAINNDILFSGCCLNGHPELPSSILAIDRRDGGALHFLEVDSEVRWLAVKDDRLFARTLGSDYVFDIDNEAARRKPETVGEKELVRLDAVVPKLVTDQARLVTQFASADYETFEPPQANDRVVALDGTDNTRMTVGDWIRRSNLANYIPISNFELGAFSGLATRDAVLPEEYAGYPLTNVIGTPLTWILVYGNQATDEIGAQNSQFIFGVDRRSKEAKWGLDVSYLDTPISWAAHSDRMVYVDLVHRGNLKAALIGIDLESGRVAWVANYVHIGANFELRGDLIFSGCCWYEGGGIPAIYAIDARSGLVRQTVPIEEEPDYLFARDDQLFVRAGDTQLVFEILE